MNVEKNRRRAMLSWLFVGALLVLCGVLGFLQYRWIGEVSIAARERLQSSLQASLGRLIQDFDSEIAAECRLILPPEAGPDASSIESEVSTRYSRWKSTTPHAQIFHRIALAFPQEETTKLRILDPVNAGFSDAEWPAEWKSVQNRLESRLSRDPGARRPRARFPMEDASLAFEAPLLTISQPDGPPVPFGRRAAWLIFELNEPYVRDAILPELVQRHLSVNGTLDYQVEIVARANPASIIYASHPSSERLTRNNADASIGIFDLPYDQLFRPNRFPAMGDVPRSPDATRNFGRRRPPPDRPRVPEAIFRNDAIDPSLRPSGPDRGRWQLLVRHRAGSLEAAVAQARSRNLAVTAGVFVLMLTAIASLLRLTRRSQKLAELQMDFVAGVSHELRTPLTVIHTAAYNLRGVLARNPTQVERYGSLIQQESARLKELVEQILQFAAAKAGRVIREPEPISVARVIEESMEASKGLIQDAHFTVEKNVDPALPTVLGDPIALKHALENLLSNAIKYGANGTNWIGVSASKSAETEPPGVEIRVADHGPGIPDDEQDHIFDPFFRGQRAIQNQVHGTGLGLNLVKKIVEAHGGSIRVKSEPMQGTEFILRIPAVPAKGPA